MVVLGIDAAWTEKNSSGVALIRRTQNSWRLLHATESVEQYLAIGNSQSVKQSNRPIKPWIDAAALLQKSNELAGDTVNVVAVDMPLSTLRITSRRTSDNAISIKYGARGCSTHSPTEDRPGPLSCQIRNQFEEQGFRLATSRIEGRCLIEVYPHPALVELASAPYRLQYKVDKRRSYWKEALPAERTRRLLEVWEEIIGLLEYQISDVKPVFEQFRLESSQKRLKATEDKLDAVICAYVGLCALEGRAEPHGDNTSAIWVPQSPVSSQ